MTRELLPYPLAGADSGPGQPNEPPVERSRSWARGLALGLVVSLGASSLWLLGLWQSERQRGQSLQAELAALRVTAEQAQDAARSAVGAPLTERQAFGSEMTVASVAVGRYLDQLGNGDAADSQALVLAFFGFEKRTTAWSRVEGRYGASGVLAALDNPDDPRLIWVSRRSAETIDPLAPAKRGCMQLDVARVVASAAANRPWGSGADTAPLRWWSDVYAFVPPEECG